MWSRRGTGTGALCGAVIALLTVLVVGAAPAMADSVADELIAILEGNGQLSSAQAARLREKATLEREQLKREVMDEVRVEADQIYHTEFEEMAADEKVVPSVALADSMKLSGYIQFLSSFSDNNSAAAANGDRASGANAFETTDLRETDGFSVRRARLKVSGNVGPRTKYVLYFDGDAIDDPGALDALNFNEAYIEYAPAFLDGTFAEGTSIRGGQFYVPFSREALYSSSKRLPIARSHFVNELAPFRNVGVMVYNDSLVDNRLELYGGVFNGTGENEDDNDPFLIAGRIQFLAVDGAETGLGTADWSIGGAIAASSDGNGMGGNGAFDILDPIFIAGQEGEIQYRGDRLLLTADTQLDIGRFGLNSEFIYGDYDVRGSVENMFAPTLGAGTALVEANAGIGGGDDDVKLVRDDEFWGFHVMPSFWIIEDTLQGYVKYEYLDLGNVLDANMWGTTVGLNYHLLPSHRHMLRFNWVHLEHESDVLGPNMGLLDDDLEQDFFLLEWQVKI